MVGGDRERRVRGGLSRWKTFLFEGRHTAGSQFLNPVSINLNNLP